MRRVTILVVVTILVLALAAPALAKKNDKKTWVCHLTHSETNPVILVHVADGWDNGHGSKKGSKHQDGDVEYTGTEPVKAGPAPQEIIDNLFTNGVCDFGSIPA